jgi:hypothetical protein
LWSEPQLLIDGHEPVIALSARALGLKLVELPDTVLLGDLGDLGGTSTTIALLRQLRAGACHQADNNVPVLVIGADTDTDRIRLLPRRRRRAATKRLLAAAARGCGRSARPAHRSTRPAAVSCCAAPTPAELRWAEPV